MFIRACNFFRCLVDSPLHRFTSIYIFILYIHVFVNYLNRLCAEMERVAEMLVLGAYYKMSSTAFVTFNSRVTKIVASKMLLSHDQVL